MKSMLQNRSQWFQFKSWTTQKHINLPIWCEFFSLFYSILLPSRGLLHGVAFKIVIFGLFSKVNTILKNASIFMRDGQFLGSFKIRYTQLRTGRQNSWCRANVGFGSIMQRSDNKVRSKQVERMMLSRITARTQTWKIDISYAGDLRSIIHFFCRVTRKNRVWIKGGVQISHPSG